MLITDVWIKYSKMKIDNIKQAYKFLIDFICKMWVYDLIHGVYGHKQSFITWMSLDTVLNKYQWRLYPDESALNFHGRRMSWIGCAYRGDIRKYSRVMKIPTGSRKKEWRSVNGDLWGAPGDKDYSRAEMLQNREVSNSLVVPECALDFVRWKRRQKLQA